MGRISMIGAGLVFAVFCVNIAIGKIAVLQGSTQVPGLGDVGEFLVLFVAVILFIIGCLSREQASTSDTQPTSQHSTGDSAS